MKRVADGWAACVRAGAEKIRNEELGMRNGCGGAQVGKRRLLKHDSGYTAVLQMGGVRMDGALSLQP